MYVEILPNVAKIENTYHYKVPDNLAPIIAFGQLVIVPFGNRLSQGIVISLDTNPPRHVTEYKEVVSVVDLQPVITKEQLILAYWLSSKYCATLAHCVIMMLPPGLTQRVEYSYDIDTNDVKVKSRLQQQVVNLIQERGPLLGNQIRKELSPSRWRPVVNTLLSKGILTQKQVVFSPKVRPKYVSIVILVKSKKEIETTKHCFSTRSQTVNQRRAGIVDFLLKNNNNLEIQEVCKITESKRSDILALQKQGYVTVKKTEKIRDSLNKINARSIRPPSLVPGQRDAWKVIQKEFDLTIPRPFLLHGVTGSGKTEIYMRAVSETLARGKQAIVLVPEISLTVQTVRRFMERFPNEVGLQHSKLSLGERYDTWRRARSGNISIIIGARSALFVPLPNIGLIVVDEEHEEAYRQDPPVQPPYYNARDAAVQYAKTLGAVCILGSATPDIVSTTLGNQGDYIKVDLPNRIMGHGDDLLDKTSTLGIQTSYQAIDSKNLTAQYIGLPSVTIVDMRSELKTGNRSIFSRKLYSSLSEVIEAKQQAILFINRRGYASYVFCRDCGYVVECSRCNIPYTYHQYKEQLLCHHCNQTQVLLTVCNKCNSTRIKHFGLGTESVEAEIQKLFPSARTLRWDRDSSRGVGAHDAIMQTFVERDADILIGTQMIAKGLDLPMVTLVGVISCDTGLTLPDYRAAERTFQVLTQVAGRSGRGVLGGQAVMQTYMPNHHSIVAASKHDYEMFYTKEMELRRKYNYPPFAELLRLVGSNKDLNYIKNQSIMLASKVQEKMTRSTCMGIDIVGPVPCYFSKIGDNYRWQIVLRGPKLRELLDMKMPVGWRLEVDPLNLL
ncbi:MAG TPA: primosomal protein N' [Chloroflexi bacterium]|nr:primosomal protein N' [Chloroflexota bacterium]